MKSELLPTFILQQNEARSVSDKISEFWYHRWAHNRILNEEIEQKIASNSFTSTGSHSSFVLLPEKEDE
jgi:rhamnogalacturonyl hydrolase YesR